MAKLPLTKKDLQEALKPLATKQDLQSQTKELKAYARQQTEELAGMIKHGFDKVDERFDAVSESLDVRQHLAEHDRQITKIAQALNVEL